MLNRGASVSEVARTLCCARSSVGRWINWFTLYGTDGLKSLPPGRGRRWPFENICSLLRQLVKHSPGDFGYQRSRWNTELMAIKIREITGCHLHASTVRRWLPGPVWSGEERPRRSGSVTHIRKTKWPLSTPLLRCAARKTRCFTKTRWIAPVKRRGCYVIKSRCRAEYRPILQSRSL